MTGSMNPQRRFGADVVSRLDAAVHSSECADEMTELIRSELAELAAALCRKTAIAWSDVQQIAIAGNPAMQHILMGLSLKSLAFPPSGLFTPAVPGLKPATWVGPVRRRSIFSRCRAAL